jgi:pilus assembly protein CpaB
VKFLQRSSLPGLKAFAMNRSQIVVLGISLVAGGAAFMMMSGDNPQAPVPAFQPPAPTVEQVLVATRDLTYGAEIVEADISWAEWPKASVPAGAITKSGSPNAIQDVTSSYVRVPMMTGDPVRRERLVKGAATGLMSTMLGPGMRAVAIDVSLNSTAGGFILPNDHVDVLRIYRDAEASREEGREVYASELLLANVRVLAIGQTVEKKGSESTATGSTATLELDPNQAEFILVAQRGGLLTLMLRPIVDAQKKAGEDDPQRQEDTKDEGLTLVRRGLPSKLRAR